MRGSGIAFKNGDFEFKFARIKKPNNKCILFQNVE